MALIDTDIFGLSPPADSEENGDSDLFSELDFHPTKYLGAFTACQSPESAEDTNTGMSMETTDVNLINYLTNDYDDQDAVSISSQGSDVTVISNEQASLNLGTALDCTDMTDAKHHTVKRNTQPMVLYKQVDKQKLSNINKIKVVFAKPHVGTRSTSVCQSQSQRHKVVQDYESLSTVDDAIANEKAAQKGFRLSMSKNAIVARENRIRKKIWLAGIEESAQKLSSENTTLKRQVRGMQSVINDLTEEVEYLKNILANESALSGLLKNIGSTAGVNFSPVQLGGITTNNNLEGPRSRKRPLMVEEEGKAEKENSNNTECRKSERKGASTLLPGKVQKLDHDYASQSKRFKTRIKGKSLYTQPSQQRNKSGDSSDEEIVVDDDVRPSGSAGVCLHVSNKTVSLEFCSACSSKAARSRAPTKRGTT